MLTTKEAEKIMQESTNREQREEAQRVLVQAASFEQSAWGMFEQNHTGVRGLYSSGNTQGDPENLVNVCEANQRMLFKYCKENFEEGVTPTGLEKAFVACRKNLAPVTSRPQDNTGADRITRQGQRQMYIDQESPAIAAHRAQQQTPVLPFTKKDLLEMANNDTPRFKALVTKFGSPAINKILQSE